MSTKLPILNAPRFNDTLPSTGEDFTYRPFLVKEEKYMQLTKDSEDINVIYESLKSLISSCTSLENVEKLSLFDIEYIFLRLREKSVGDIIELKMKHIDVEDCDHVETVNLDLKNIRVQKYEGHTNLLLLDKQTNVKIKMRYPKYKDVLRLQQGQGDFDSFMEVLISCTEMVTQNDDVFMMKDFSDKDKKEFFLNFNMTHMESVKSFFDTMPKVCYDLEWTCSKCGKKESHTIEGVQSFLS
jgi:hypothetical protein|tara:strand:- start:1029 stop:1751 length:723 start_codon:yes stop_codon:yes gene_type:complete